MNKELIEKYWLGLSIIAGLRTKEERDPVIRFLSKEREFRRLIRWICQNFQDKKIPLDEQTRKKLIKHRAIFMEICNKKLSVKKKRDLTIQSGGFLPILIPILASVIGEIISRRNAS